jgi:hypothetical protein
LGITQGQKKNLHPLHLHLPKEKNWALLVHPAFSLATMKIIIIKCYFKYLAFSAPPPPPPPPSLSLSLFREEKIINYFFIKKF